MIFQGGNVSAPMKRHMLAVLFIVALGAFLYANSLGNGFVLDDRIVVKNNNFIASTENLRHFFNREEYFRGSREATYRPAVTLTYVMDCALWRYDPAGYHLTNVIIHIVNGVLFYFILVNFLTFAGRKRLNLETEKPYHSLLPLVAALFFLSHPVQTEAVDFIGGRHDILMTLFYLAGIFFYQKAGTSKRVGGAAFYALSLAMYFLSCLSKEMGITLPAMIILMDCFGKRHAERRTFVKNWVPYLGYALVASAYLYIRFFGMVYPGELKTMAGQAFTLDRFFPAAWIFLTYLRLLVFPASLSVEYVAGDGYRPLS